MDTQLGFNISLAILWQNRDIWLVLAIIFMLILAVTRVLFPKVFVSTFSPIKFFSFRQRDDFSSGLRLFSTEYLHLTFILSSALSLNLLLASDALREYTIIPDWLYPTGVLEGILIWLGLAVVLVLAFLLRYVMISGFGRLFNLPNSHTQHFQEAQSLNQLFVLFITLISLVTLFSSFYYPEYVFQTVIVLSLLYLVYREFNLYIKFVNIGGYSKLFIFSYLCTTEIIPVLIGIKLLS